MSGPLRVRRDLREGSHPHSLVYGPPSAEIALIALNDHTASQVEAQLAPHADLRIVDVSESGLPKWPDLTELRDALSSYLVDPYCTTSAHLVDVIAAARRLVYPEGDA